MTADEKIACIITAVFLLAIAGFMVASWWTGREPGRPKGVAANAAFLWAPHLPFPGPRRGWWLSCWENAGHNRCKLSDVNGALEYEGEFTPYSKRGFVASDQLKIDPEKTRDNKVWIGEALVPLVYLQNGEILIPVDKYDEGARLVDKARTGPNQ